MHGGRECDRMPFAKELEHARSADQVFCLGEHMFHTAQYFNKTCGRLRPELPAGYGKAPPPFQEMSRQGHPKIAHRFQRWVKYVHVVQSPAKGERKLGTKRLRDPLPLFRP